MVLPTPQCVMTHRKALKSSLECWIHFGLCWGQREDPSPHKSMTRLIKASLTWLGPGTLIHKPSLKLKSGAAEAVLRLPEDQCWLKEHTAPQGSENLILVVAFIVLLLLWLCDVVGQSSTTPNEHPACFVKPKRLSILSTSYFRC